MNKKKYSTLLIWSAALISVVRYMGAFIASDVGSIGGTTSEVLTFLMGITGIGMGLLDSIGTAFLFNGWRLAMPRTGDKWKPRFKILTFFVFALFLTGLCILIPFTVSRVSHMSMWEILGEGGTWVWSLFVNVAPVLIIGGVMSGNANMVTDDDGSKVSNKSKVSETFKKEQQSSSDWRKIRPKLSNQDIIKLAGMEIHDIQNSFKDYNVSERTAWNWREYAKTELGVKNEN